MQPDGAALGDQFRLIWLPDSVDALKLPGAVGTPTQALLPAAVIVSVSAREILALAMLNI